MQILLISILVSLSVGFLSGCETAARYYKVKDLNSQVKILKDRSDRLAKALNDTESANEKLDKSIKTNTITLETIVREEVIVPGPCGNATIIDANGMRQLLKLRGSQH